MRAVAERDLGESFGSLKKVEKTFEKVLDKEIWLWYNNRVAQKGRRKNRSLKIEQQEIKYKAKHKCDEKISLNSI